MKAAIRTLALVTGFLLVGGLAVAAVATNRDATPEPVPALVVNAEGRTPGPSATPTPRSDDLRGNCDEPEHAGDLACRDGRGREDITGRGHDDRSGPSDDRSGPSEGSGPGSHDDGEHEDRSGPGPHDDRDDDSGRGSDDDRGDDDSGHGSDHDDRDDDSGHGSDDD